MSANRSLCPHTYIDQIDRPTLIDSDFSATALCAALK
jgi:hypothetical protein